MAELVAGRVCAEIEQEIVVFLIGMRINKLWKIWRWLPVAKAMTGMLRELAAHPELGMLGVRQAFNLRDLSSVQYWRSAAHLQAFAGSSANAHLPAWQAFHRSIGTNGDVGIWHETYVVSAGNLESIYLNMPRFGLGLVGRLLPASGKRATAARRLAGADHREAAEVGE
nr:DUF4188 domain-containing protein [uncultured Lichenicoccus sp.]